MGDLPISSLLALPGASAADGDLIEVCDISDLSMPSATGRNKKMSMSEFAVAMRTRINAAGDVTGPLSALVLANSGVTAGTYGDSTHSARITFDSKGRATAATNVAIAGGAGGGTGSGGPVQYVSYALGNDSNDGLTWNGAKKTIIAAVNTLLALPGGFVRGVIYLSEGRHVTTDQIQIPASVSLIGNLRSAHFGLDGYNSGSYIEWDGPNTAGKAVIETGFSGDPNSGYAHGARIEHVTVYIPFTTATSGLSTSNITGWRLKNWQNMSKIYDCRVQGGRFIGFEFTKQGTPGLGYPGFCTLEDLWVINGPGSTFGPSQPFVFHGMLEGVTMRGCKCDDYGLAVPSTSAMVTVMNDGDGSQQGSLTLDHCEWEGGVLSASGASGDCAFVKVEANPGGGTPNNACTVVIVAPYAQNGGANRTTPFVNYLAAPVADDDDICGAPVFVYGAQTQSYETLVYAPAAVGGALVVKPETVPSGGSLTHWSYDHANRAGRSIKSISTTGLVSKADISLCDTTAGAFAIYVPTAVGRRGQKRTFKRVAGSNSLNILTQVGTEAIDGSVGGLAITTAPMTVVSDGTNWWSI